MSELDMEKSAERILAELANEFPLREMPEIVWRNLRVTAGIAYYRTNRIALSRILLVDESRLRTTLVHEYAHLMAVERHGSKAANHGRFWQQAMRELGAEPKRTHEYEVQRNAPRQTVAYQCKLCGVEFVRTRRLPRRKTYVHADCGGGLRLISVSKTTNSESMP